MYDIVHALNVAGTVCKNIPWFDRNKEEQCRGGGTYIIRTQQKHKLQSLPRTYPPPQHWGGRGGGEINKYTCICALSLKSTRWTYIYIYIYRYGI